MSSITVNMHTWPQIYIYFNREKRKPPLAVPYCTTHGEQGPGMLKSAIGGQPGGPICRDYRSYTPKLAGFGQMLFYYGRPNPA